MNDNQSIAHLSEFLNNLNSMNREKFLEGMRQLHPTLQQTFAGHMFAWINEYATIYRQDDRNAQSIETARRLRNGYLAWSSQDDKIRENFPLI